MNPLKCILLTLLMIFSTLTLAQVDTISYSLGVNLGQRLAKQGARNIEYQSFMQGIKAALEGQKILLGQGAIDKISFDYYQSQKKKISQMIEEEGLSFLAENGKRPEVITTESGLQYEVLSSSDGEKPTAQSPCHLH